MRSHDNTNKNHNKQLDHQKPPNRKPTTKYHKFVCRMERKRMLKSANFKNGRKTFGASFPAFPPTCILAKTEMATTRGPHLELLLRVKAHFPRDIPLKILIEAWWCSWEKLPSRVGVPE
jgi:hypothetical protein